MDPKIVPSSKFSSASAALHVGRLFERYGIHANGAWSEDAIRVLEESSFLFFGLAPDNFRLWHWVENLSIRLEEIPQGGLTSKNLIRLNPANLTNWTVIHELAHAWDASQGWKLSAWFAVTTGSQINYPLIHRLFPKDKRFWYAVGSPPPPCGSDATFNRLEDFAESVTATLFPEEAKRRADQRGWGYETWGYRHFHDTPRGKLIHQLVHPQ